MPDSDLADEIRCMDGGSLKPILIKIGDITLRGELNESSTARSVWDALPIRSNGHTWGDEIYFKIPVAADLEAPKATVNPGDIAYWPTGHAFCIFYGRTPASGEDDIVPASPVDVIGRINSDLGPLKGITDPGRVLVEKGM
jgi:hypothetical protein